jgi:hypothetical protein
MVFGFLKLGFAQQENYQHSVKIGPDLEMNCYPPMKLSGELIERNP